MENYICWPPNGEEDVVVFHHVEVEEGVLLNACNIENDVIMTDDELFAVVSLPASLQCPVSPEWRVPIDWLYLIPQH